MTNKGFERVDTNGLSFYRSDNWSGLRHGVFTRRGGASEGCFRSLNLGASIGDDLDAVRENHARMYQALDINAERATSCWLVHSVDALVVDDSMKGRHLQKADALITALPDTPLVMRYADCVPLIAFDPNRHVIGLAHAGWRGTVDGMAGKLIQALRAHFRCVPVDVEVLLGPAISRRNYEVGEDVAAMATGNFGAESGVVWRDADGAAHLDLWRANEIDLRRNGVERVQVMDICTYDSADDFFSHRAEGGRTGRFGVAVSL